MDRYSEDFKNWMDERRLTSESLAPLMQKEEGTLRNWRSRGVPTRSSVRAHVTQFMADFDSGKIKEFKTLDVLNLEVDPQKFDAWNKAALSNGLIMRDWAIQGLDEMAKRELTSRKSVNYDFNRKNDQMVAEYQQEFNAPEDGEREED